MNRLSALALQLRAVWMLLGVALILFISTPYFFTSSNLLAIALAASVTALLAIGETFVIILGEIDLSVGAMLGFTSVITAMVLPDHGLVMGLLAGLAAGAGAGLINGLLVTKVNMPSFIATLASLCAQSSSESCWLAAASGGRYTPRATTSRQRTCPECRSTG